MPATLLRLMGESDIIDIDPGQQGQDVHPRLMGLDESDRINLLGHWLDHDQGMAMSDDPDTMSAIISIAAGFLSASGSVPGWGSEVNFVVMTILRERWPVGSKSTYRTVAERVGATPGSSRVVVRLDARIGASVSALPLQLYSGGAIVGLAPALL